MFSATPIRNRYRVCSKVPMRFPGRRLNLKTIYRTFYVHAHAIRSISLYALSRLCIYRSDRRASVPLVFRKGHKIREPAIANPLRTVHTFSISGPHRRFRQARGNVGIDWLPARLKTGIISTQIWFGTPDGINIFVGNGRWWRVEGVSNTWRCHEIRFSSVAWILLSRKREKVSRWLRISRTICI